MYRKYLPYQIFLVIDELNDSVKVCISLKEGDMQIFKYLFVSLLSIGDDGTENKTETI